MTKIVVCLGGKQTAADPPTSFLSLPGELRNKIYELSLVHEERLHPWGLYEPLFTGSLFRASKTIHREASPVFYGQNRFDFSGVRAVDIRLFLEQIGKNNASYVRFVTIDFPYITCLQGDRARDDISIIEAFRGSCNMISTITTSLRSTDSVERKLHSMGDFRVVSEALALVDARFRSIPSIQEIIVEVYEFPLCERFRKTVEGHGWVIKTMPKKRIDGWWASDLGAIYCGDCDYENYDWIYRGGDWGYENEYWAR